jgi:hypothetical protein
MSAHPWLYWLVTGAMFGLVVLGALDAPTQVLPCLAVGLILAAVGAVWLRGRGLWAMLVGLGGMPVVFLVGDVITAIPWHCITPGRPDVSSGDSSGFYCITTPIGPVNAYFIFALPFELVALIGLAFPLARRLRERIGHAES